MKHKYPYSLNTDDSGIFNSTITKEILHMYYAIEMSLSDIVISLGKDFTKLTGFFTFNFSFNAENSIDYSFLSIQEKERLQELFWKKMTSIYSIHSNNSDLKDVFLAGRNNGEEIDMSSLYTL